MVKLECSEETELPRMGVSYKVFLGRGARACWDWLCEKVFFLASVSLHFRLIGQFMRIYLPLSFLWHKIGEPSERVVAFWKPFSVTMILVSLNYQTTPLNLFFDVNYLATTSSNLSPYNIFSLFLLASFQLFCCYS